MEEVILINHPYLDRYVNSFILNTHNFSLLFDTGMKSGRQNIEDAATGFPVIFCTHGHFDHIGSHKYFQQKGAKVFAHQEEFLNMQDPERQWNIGFAQFKNDCKVSPELKKIFLEDNREPIKADVALDDGQVLQYDNCSIEVLHTPGHTAGSLCYYLPKQDSLITGDTLMGSELYWSMPIYSDPVSYINSLKRIQKLKVEKVYACHDDMFLGKHLKQRTSYIIELVERFDKIIHDFFAARKNDNPPLLKEVVNALVSAENKQANTSTYTVVLGHLDYLYYKFPSAAALRNKYLPLKEKRF